MTKRIYNWVSSQFVNSASVARRNFESIWLPEVKGLAELLAQSFRLLRNRHVAFTSLDSGQNKLEERRILVVKFEFQFMQHPILVFPDSFSLFNVMDVAEQTWKSQ